MIITKQTDSPFISMQITNGDKEFYVFNNKSIRIRISASQGYYIKSFAHLQVSGKFTDKEMTVLVLTLGEIFVPDITRYPDDAYEDI